MSSSDSVPIQDIDGLAHFLSEVGQPRLSVVHFWADWATQCGPMDEAIKILAGEDDLKRQNVAFLRVEAETEAEISMKYEVAAVPTFLFFCQGKLWDRIEGAKAADVTKKVRELSAKQALEAKLCPPPPAGANASAGNAPSSKAQPAQPKDLNTRLKELINASRCMLFMKGSPSAPECGFSRTTVALLDGMKADYGHFDIHRDNEVRQGLKEYSKWPTYPQLYLDGELLGGLDILKEMHESNELESMLPKKKSLDDRLKELTNQAKLMVFMKGNPSQPKCGFSRQLMEILAQHEATFDTFDILLDEEVRQGLKKFSDWPTYPQIYHNGELIGGLDIIKEMVQEGELKELLK